MKEPLLPGEQPKYRGPRPGGGPYPSMRPNQLVRPYVEQAKAKR